MKKSFHKTMLKAWTKFREIDRKFSPGAPQSNEMTVYKHYLNSITPKRKNLKMLVLGATPELRDFGISLGYEVLAVDINMEMLNSLTSIMKHKNHERNLMMLCNWFKLGNLLKLKIFDVIMSDGSFNNIQFKDYKKIFLIIRQLLKPGGYFIDRHLITNFKKLKPIEDREKQYIQRKVTLIDLIHGLYLGSSKIKIWHNPKTELFNLGKFYSWAKNNSKNPKFSSLRRKIYNEIAKRHRVGYHAVITENEFKNLVKKYFKIIQIERPANFGFIPLYLLKKK